MSGADYTTQGAVTVIRLDNPPVNGLAYAVRTAVVAGLDKANADPAIAAIVITGAGKAFPAGADTKKKSTHTAPTETTPPNVNREAHEQSEPVLDTRHNE